LKEELRGPVVVRDVKRLDSYPHVDDKPRVISPWFRVGLIGTYHKGIQLGLGRGKLKKAEGGVEWRCTDHKSGENGDLAVVLVGRIPYERIEDVDWRGDEYYPFPHIYCHFDCTNGEPYETVAFCIERHHPDACPSYIEVAPYERVRRASKKAGIDPSF